MAQTGNLIPPSATSGLSSAGQGDVMKPMRDALAGKTKSMLAKIGGKPSPAFVGGKRKTPKGFAGAPVPTTPSLPIPGSK